RLAEPVAHVLERGVPGIARDREHALESGVQPDALAVVLGLVDLEELAIRVELDGEQVGRVEDARLLAEVLADALFLGEGISHRVSPQMNSGYIGVSAARAPHGTVTEREVAHGGLT